jgi:hypothetical protein
VVLKFTFARQLTEQRSKYKAQSTRKKHHSRRKSLLFAPFSLANAVLPNYHDTARASVGKTTARGVYLRNS